MEQFKQFEIQKQAAVQSLQDLESVLIDLEQLGVDVKDDLQKVAAAIASIDSDVLRIAMFGAFSDGKTSVIAAWLGKVMADMKIDMDESSDKLAIYQPEGLPGECEIVDTPGLFGDKEHNLDGHRVMYQDLTKKYISEAHLIFYVVDATNPLKDSHSEVVQWILRDLQKLSSTVFVINKMDEVTDLTEDDLFAEQAEIKRQNLKSKLQRIAGLSPEELASLNIVCVAANPNGRGLPFWFEKMAQYEGRSRINELKATTNRVLEGNVSSMLRVKAGHDVVRDLVRRKLEASRTHLAELQAYADQNSESLTRIQSDLARGRSDIKRLSRECLQELMTTESYLLSKLRPLELDGLAGFLDDEIGRAGGEIGYKLQKKIELILSAYFDQAMQVTVRIGKDLSAQLQSSESFYSAMAERAVGSAGSALKGVAGMNPAVIKQVIFVARDTLASVTGYVIKFKPWAVSNMAAAISKWAGPVAGALQLAGDLWEMYKAAEREAKLKEIKGEIQALVSEHFKDIYDVLSSEDKMVEFFAPHLKQYQDTVEDLQKAAESFQQAHQKVVSIESRLKLITGS